TPQTKPPLARISYGILELNTETIFRCKLVPLFPCGTTGKRITTQEVGILAGDVAKARHIDTGGATARIIFILKAGHSAIGAGTVQVIHQVVAEHTGGVCNTG